MTAAIEPKAEGFVGFIQNGQWLKAIKTAAWDLIWPLLGVKKDLLEMGGEIKTAAGQLFGTIQGLGRVNTVDEFMKLAKAQVDSGVNSLLHVWGLANSVLGRMSGWIFIGSVLIGALFFGVGAAAGRRSLQTWGSRC